MRQQRRVELLKNYDCEIKCHPGKRNIVAEALSRKECAKPLRVRAIEMTIQTDLPTRIREAQQEALKPDNLRAESLRGMEAKLLPKEYGTLYFMERVWVPFCSDIRILILDEVYKLRYSIHPGSDKMYQDLKDFYWWLKMNADIAA
ncbi:uncharacterized protein LOC110875942 [Helianthus annuus]|uniref:uncharacterized protein LOC110875942 n=1 Tax=Helianthus annuus TaxID=4232 RepID=UPI000B8FF7B2|nr:uncharacterized protein LOC110875942 [Helianthus annuus]